MKRLLETINYFTLWGLGLLTLFILGSEPSNSSEESLSSYEHSTDFGNFGWFMCWGWVLCLVLFIVTTLTLYFKEKK
jgi:hypothetical protein